MALKSTVADALNVHLNYEVYSAMTYFSMSGWLEGQGLSGCASWMHVQGQEEMLHAQKFFQFIIDRDAKVDVDGIPRPQGEWENIIDIFQSSYDHECGVTSRINTLMDLALTESDHATVAFLQWFVQEQVEEEATVRDIVDKFKLIEGDGSALLLMDQELGKRNLTMGLSDIQNG